jgi:tetratricopeptide (TPR) repeat protein
MEVGLFIGAYNSAKSVMDWIEPLYIAEPNNPSLLLLRYESLWRMGDAIAEKDLRPLTQEEALKYYSQAEKLAHRLAEMEPEDADQQRRLVFALQKIGDVQQMLENWTKAQAEYGEALQIMQALVARAPENRNAQRDLANLLSRMGQALVEEGQLDAAMQRFRVALKIRADLAAKEPKDDVLQSNLATGHREIAALLIRQDKLDDALAEYRRAIKIRETLLVKDPTNANWQTSLATLYAGAGNVLKYKKDWAGALEEYRKGYALALRNRTNAVRQHNFAIAGMAVAEMLVALNGNLDEAVRLYREAIDSIDDFRPRYDQDIYRAYVKIGDIAQSRGDQEGALAEYRLALRIATESAAKDPTSAAWRNDLAESTFKVGNVLAGQGHKVEVIEQYQRILEFVQTLADKNPEIAEWVTLAQSLKAKIIEILKF